MAAGDVSSALSPAVANNAFLDLQPAAGVEVVVHNIYYEGAVEFYFYNGVQDIKFDADATAGARLNVRHHCTTVNRIRIKNVSGGAQDISYDGMQTK